MNILILNSILYTADNNIIPKVDSIKDCMIYNFALGLKHLGHTVTLIAANDYMPNKDEGYDFNIIFFQSLLKKIFLPAVFPFHPKLYAYLKKSATHYDLIISSEIFSMNTLCAAMTCPSKTLVWHELSEHNNKFKKIPSYIWHYIVAPLFMRKVLIVPRSEAARIFICKFMNNVSTEYIEHGTNLEKFSILPKKKQFVVISQLIERKRVDSIILQFADFLQKSAFTEYKLLIIGRGNQEDYLKQLTKQLKIDTNVIFCGYKPHKDLSIHLSESMGMLLNTKKDLNVVSISEAVASGTPVLTNTVPNSSHYIAKENLGIVKDNWGPEDLLDLIKNNSSYVQNCIRFRKYLSIEYSAQQMLEIFLKATHKS